MKRYTISVNGWTPGCRTIPGMKILQLYAGISMSDAKTVIDSILSGNVEQISFDHPEKMRCAVKELITMGFVASEIGEII